MSEFRRRLMMAQSGEEPIDWDYEWYAPDEIPSWFSKGTNATAEFGEDYYRIYNPSAPSNYVMKNIMNFSSSEFPVGSYIMDINMKEMVVRQANSVQGGLIFSTSKTGNTSSVSDQIWIGRLNSKISDTNYYKCCLATSTTDTDKIITDALRYTVRLNIGTEGTRISVGNVFLDTTRVGAPRGIYGRYSPSGYIDIYSIKIKAI